MMSSGKLLQLYVLAIVMTGCAGVGRRVDPGFHWRTAERRRRAVLGSVERLHQVRSHYEAVTVLARDGDLRGRAFMRLAEIELALGHTSEACLRLEQALQAGPRPATQRAILLMLADVLERRVGDGKGAEATYEQVINEHPGSTEAELAALRLEVLRYEK